MQTKLSHLIHSPTTSPTRNSGAPRCGIVATMPTTSTADPTSMPPARWQSRLAALKSRSVSDTDPRVVACREALSYWRVRRAVEAELGTGSLDRVGGCGAGRDAARGCACTRRALATIRVGDAV